MIQPEALSGMKAKGSLEGVGVLDRFIWTHAPFRLVPPVVAPESMAAKKAYEMGMDRMFEAERDREKIDLTPIKFAPEAAAHLETFFVEMNRQAETGADGTFEDREGVFMKMRPNVQRLCGWLHLAEFGYSEGAEIQLKTAKNAVIIGHYWVEHMKSAFGVLFQNEEDAGTARVLKWIKRRHAEGKLEKSPIMDAPCFKQQALWQGVKQASSRAGSIPDSATLGQILDQLSERNILKTPTGSKLWFVNPEFLER
jgi:hypothetical protein